MATITAFTALNMNNPTVWYGQVTSYNASQITLSNGPYTGTYRGSFSYDQFGNVYGVLRGYDFAVNGAPAATVSGLNVDAYSFMLYIQNGDAEGAYQLALAGGDTFRGSAYGDVLTGFGGSDTLFGNAGNDRLSGGDGADQLRGGAGRDLMAGNAGADSFVFSSVTDSVNSQTQWDVISDFTIGEDRINLRAIDAFAATALNDTFTFNETSTFSSARGEVRIKQVDALGEANDYTMVLVDTDGDKGIEMAIAIKGLHDLTATDFLL